MLPFALGEPGAGRLGLIIPARGGERGKKRAIVAVARKLSVLLHRLWVYGRSLRATPKRRDAFDGGSVQCTNGEHLGFASHAVHRATAWSTPGPFEADVKVAALHKESQNAPDFLQPTLRVRMEAKAVRRRSRTSVSLCFAARSNRGRRAKTARS
jgi:hypothetical protein